MTLSHPPEGSGATDKARERAEALRILQSTFERGLELWILLSRQENDTGRLMTLAKLSYQLINCDMDDADPRKMNFHRRRTDFVTFGSGHEHVTESERIDGLIRLLEDLHAYEVEKRRST